MARDWQEEGGTWDWERIHKAKKGFVVERRCWLPGHRYRIKILVRYGSDAAYGYGPEADLDAPYNDAFTVGGILRDVTLRWIDLPGSRVLRRGWRDR
jgi:hypothetical protein